MINCVVDIPYLLFLLFKHTRGLDIYLRTLFHCTQIMSYPLLWGGVLRALLRALCVTGYTLFLMAEENEKVILHSVLLVIIRC